MFWLYLLAAVTVLSIALRRVLRRQKPLSDEIYSSRVAIDHVHSGVAWVGADGIIVTANQAFLKTLETTQQKLIGTRWDSIFPASERSRIEELFREALLSGKANANAQAERADGSSAYVNLSLVVVHDHKLRFVGHHCLIEDRTRLLELEAQLLELGTQVDLGKPRLVPRGGETVSERGNLQIVPQ